MPELSLTAYVVSYLFSMCIVPGPICNPSSDLPLLPHGRPRWRD